MILSFLEEVIREHNIGDRGSKKIIKYEWRGNIRKKNYTYAISA